jgi:hypothetical protein
LLDAAGNVRFQDNGQPIPGSVYFTSFNDKEIGVANDTIGFDPQPGDWGGLVFRDDRDQADDRFNYEDQGIFLNHVNHADIRYGGGTVVIDSVSQVVAPIHLVDARPTISYNRITRSGDAAISASPDSFEETNFHAPEHQFHPFTSDYRRVGPDIGGNYVADNSINGLFIRLTTPAGNELVPMTVSGRFNDEDITHVVAHNLLIQGAPGGPVHQVSLPSVVRVGLQPLAGGDLEAGRYNYKIVFVDIDGNEGPASSPTSSVLVTGAPAQGSIRYAGRPDQRQRQHLCRHRRHAGRRHPTGDASPSWGRNSDGVSRGHTGRRHLQLPHRLCGRRRQ